MIQVEADLRRDWNNILRQRLAGAGFRIDPNADTHDLWQRYFTLQDRLIHPWPRRAVRSKEFQCHSDVAAGLSRLLQLIEKGVNVNANLSTKIADESTQDKLMSEWGIHHFHLGLDPYARDPRFMDRTDYLLYAKVTNDTVYCIDVRLHQQKGFATWVDPELIEIVHRNWPALIEPARCDEIIPGAETSTASVSGHRKSNMALCVVLKDGTMYLPINGGVTTAGTSTWATMRGIDAASKIDDIDTWARKEAAYIRDTIREGGFPVGDAMRFTLETDDAGFLLRETQFNVTVRVPPVR